MSSSSFLNLGSYSEEDLIPEGSIYFTCDYYNKIPFMITSENIQISNILQKIVRNWNVKIPRIALFIISDPELQYAWKDSQNVNSLVSGLLDAINALDMWIFTNGLNSGIVMEIGKCLYKERLKDQDLEQLGLDLYSSRYEPGQKQFPEPTVSLIGICPQNSITYSQALVPSYTSVRLDNNKYIYKEGKFDLNPNHTHFIIAKDKNFAEVQALTFTICEKIFQKLQYHSVLNFPSSVCTPHLRILDVPVVALLIQGKLHILKFIYKHLQSKLPLIIIYGSGGLSDLLSYAYFEVKNMPVDRNPTEYAEKVLKSLIQTKVSLLFPNIIKSSLEMETIYDNVLKCIRLGSKKDCELITVLDTKRDDTLKELRQQIFRALCKSQPRLTPLLKSDYFIKKNLHLAVDWNCPIIAVKEILGKRTHITSVVDEQLFVRVLLRPQREKFVELFLQRGFLLHKILSVKTLVSLFCLASKEVFFSTVILERFLNQEQGIEITEHFIDDKLSLLVEKLTGLRRFINTKSIDRPFGGLFPSISKEEAEDKALATIIVWAVFTFRMNLLMAIWKNTNQPVGFSMFIAMLLRGINEKVYEVSIKIVLHRYYNIFSKLSPELLNAYYKVMPGPTYNFIQEKNSMFSYKNTMEMAAFANNVEFLSHPCCQRYLDQVFMGHIKFNFNLKEHKIPEFVQLVLSVFFIFPTYIFISFFVTVDENVSDLNFRKENKNDDFHKLFIRKSKFSKFSKYSYHPKKYDDDDKDPEVYFYRPIINAVKVNPNLINKMYYLWNAPVTKFYTFHFVYLSYLCLFSISILWPFCGNAYIDNILIIWSFINFHDSIASIIHMKQKHKDVGITMEITQVITFLIVIIVYVPEKLIDPSQNYGIISTERHKYVKYYATTILLFLFYTFMWSFLPISSTLGPLLYRVRTMIQTDFWNFFKVSLVLIISNSIALHSLRYPNTELERSLLDGIFRFMWRYLLGVPYNYDYGIPNTECITFIENSKNKSCRAGSYAKSYCENRGLWPFLFMVPYITILQMVFFTTLYALFRHTHANYEGKSDQIWKVQRYKLVIKAKHSIMPFPFSLLFYFHSLTKFIKIYGKFKGYPKRLAKSQLTRFTERSRVFYLAFKKYFQDLKESTQNDESKEKEILEDINRRLNKQTKTFITLQRDLTNLKYNVCTLNKHLMEETKFEMFQNITGRFIFQKLSRQNPYPQTQVNRFPVPDSYVSWAVDYLLYDPVTFTMPSTKFDKAIRDYVDEDLDTHVFDEKQLSMPKFNWNEEVVTLTGMFINRKSSIIDECDRFIKYKIDLQGMPQNPMGRTGLQGKGSLPRWGPNHYIYAFISTSSFVSPWNYRNHIKFVSKIMPNTRSKFVITLPGGFIKTEFKYEEIRNCFSFANSQDDAIIWKDSAMMLSFFKSCVLKTPTTERKKTSEGKKIEIDNNSQADDGVYYEIVNTGYMDDSLNTDNAWKEIELWHIHYKRNENLMSKFGSNLQWQILNQRTYSQMEESLSVLIKNIKFENDIFL